MQLDSEVLDNGICRINLAGRMDIQGTQDIDMKFTGISAKQRAVIVDMSAVEFLASIGIRTLLLSAKAIGSRGGKMVVLNPDANVRKVLEMAGIDTLIPIFVSLEDARTAVTA